MTADMTADDTMLSGETQAATHDETPAEHDEHDEEQIEITSEQAADQMLLYAFDQAVEMLEAGEGFDPFTILLKDDEFFIEDHACETIEECAEAARVTIQQMALVASDYVFVYDGYVELDEGQKDAVIAERAHTGDAEAEVFAMLYEEHGDHLHFDETLYGIGNATSYFIAETADTE